MIAPGAQTLVKVFFTPDNPVKRPGDYTQDIQLRVQNSPRMLTLPATGSGFLVKMGATPKELDLGASLPNVDGAGAFVRSDFKLTNPSKQAIEIIAVDFDKQYLEEEQMLREATRYNEELGYMLLRPRLAGDPFWPDVAAQVAELRAAKAVADAAEAARQVAAAERKAADDERKRKIEAGEEVAKEEVEAVAGVRVVIVMIQAGTVVYPIARNSLELR